MKILDLLAEKGDITNTQLAKKLGLAKSTITHHLKLLADAGIVSIARTEYEEHGIPMKFYKLKANLIPLTVNKEVIERYSPIRVEVKKEMKNFVAGEKPLRENLGDQINMGLFRAIRSATLAAGIEIDGLLYEQGYDLGETVFAGYMQSDNLDELLLELAGIWKKLRLGIVEVVGKKGQTITIRVFECYDCAYMPNVGKALCFFDAGIIAGILDTKREGRYSVEEVKCWGTGYTFCEFVIKPQT
jgi:hypothetical protein